MTREVVQIVEIKQPFCKREYACGFCNGGLANVDTSDATIDFAEEGQGNWSGNGSTLITELSGVGIQVDENGQGSTAAIEVPGLTIDGDNFRYVIVHGKAVTAVSPAFQLRWSNTITNDVDTIRTIQEVFRGVNADELSSGDEFVGIFDMADSSDYATDWLGSTITEIRIDFDNGAGHRYEVYSIKLSDTSPYDIKGGECYNVRATCQDADNFSLGDPLSLYFSRGNVADRQEYAYLTDTDGSYILDVDGEYIAEDSDWPRYIIPSLLSVSTTPARINLAGADDDAKPIGMRAACNIVFQDHPHSDRKTDPYLSDRSFNPMDATRGSFWTRWIKRNRYRQNVEIVVYEGYAHQLLADMTKRTYFIQGVNHSGDSGRVTITGQDILTRIEEKKAQAPLASPGVLQTDITGSATTFEATNATEDDYDATGTLRIGDEVMTYTGRANSTNGVTFTGVTRGTDNTTADSHDAEDGVQQCLRFSAATVDGALTTLLTTYGGVSSAWIDTAGWTAEADDYLAFYAINGLVTEPTGVVELVSAIVLQSMCYIWWDERTSLIKLKTIRGIEEEPETLTAEANIIAGSFSISEKPEDRASQAWVYWGKRNPTEDRDDPGNFTAVEVYADLASEAAEKYGEAAIRKVYADFLSAASPAGTTASKIITRFAEVPRECTFEMDAKDRAYWLGDQFYISHPLDVDENGLRNLSIWTVVEAEEVMPGERVRYRCEDTSLYGRINYIMANGTADYPGAASVPFKNAFIGNDAGLLSDGNPCARIN